MDLFGRAALSEERRRCSVEDASVFEQHLQTTLAYSVLWAMISFIGPVDGAFENLAAQWGLDLNICDTMDCSDISTPWGLAYSLLTDAKTIFSKDGWNADGSLSSTFNRIPYADWRRNPFSPNLNYKDCWKPLLETDQNGFLYRQDHVTPHIGFTAKSFFVGDDKIC